jgi:hypothetical protein
LILKDRPSLFQQGYHPRRLEFSPILRTSIGHGQLGSITGAVAGDVLNAAVCGSLAPNGDIYVVARGI